MGENNPLDLFSTSPTGFVLPSSFSSQNDTETMCSYGAPFFAYKLADKTYGVGQGCCNHWDCPRCGIMRAKHEYGRIVEGCRTIAKANRISFITITCRGKSLSRKDALAGYLGWTNRFLDACRAKAKRDKQPWVYVQVTELQKRGHPHSHILTTFDPDDTYLGKKTNWQTEGSGKRTKTEKDALISPWIQARVISAGLGEQYDISFVETVEGASRYVAKYLFKKTIFTDIWPKGWKRVRYSQSFPKLKEKEATAFVLLGHEDWYKLSKVADVVRTKTTEEWYTAKTFLKAYGTTVK